MHGQPKYGIGATVQIEKVNFNTVKIFAWIVIIALISILFEYINKKLLKEFIGWKNEKLKLKIYINPLKIKKYLKILI